MQVADFATKYPRVYHLSEAGSWATIERHGLLSTSDLLDLYCIDDERRTRLLTRQRSAPEVLEHSHHGRVVLRDQKALSESKLAACLVGMTVAEWLRLLNGRVFFWLDARRLNELLAAKEYRSREHDVITVDTARLLERYENQAHLSRINSGSTLFRAAEHGANTFRSLPLYDILERRAPVELTIEGSVPEIKDYVVSVERRRAC